MRRWAIALGVLTMTPLLWAQPWPSPPPTISSPEPSRITGTIQPAEMVESLSAVSRATGQRTAAESFDRSTGNFSFAKLPGDAKYDLCVRLKDGRRIEGIDLEFVDARLLRMAETRREQLRLPAEEIFPITSKEVDALISYVRDLDDFCDLRRALYLQGNSRRAAMLVELMRTRDFHESADNEFIWRIELWYFERHSGGWVRVPHANRVLEREQLPREQWQEISIEYDPAWSVYIDAQGKSEPIHLMIPEKSDPSRGRVAGTPPTLKTPPHIIGGAVETATRPTVELPQSGQSLPAR